MNIGHYLQFVASVLIIFFTIGNVEGQLGRTQRQRSRFVLRQSSRPTTRVGSTMADLLRQRQRQRMSLQGTSNANEIRRQLLRMIAARRSGSTSSSAGTRNTIAGVRNRSRVITQCPSISCVQVPANCRRLTFYMTETGRRCRGCDFNRCENFQSRWEKGFSRIE
ncbi:uncharacterized protein LOC134250714 [Saccostrea cucullata]|uniref:uncharacterized protein LOC134250714 n=1 Tax=Saccostrea cuccullata TaxID=36930 RepID=UPI002ED6106F